jgi:hypothetical protein
MWVKETTKKILLSKLIIFCPVGAFLLFEQHITTATTTTKQFLKTRGRKIFYRGGNMWVRVYYCIKRWCPREGGLERLQRRVAAASALRPPPLFSRPQLGCDHTNKPILA